MTESESPLNDEPDSDPTKRDGLPLEPTVTNLTGPPRLAVDSVLADRYRILEMLGIGAMGMVYRAHDQELDLEVALKVLRPELGHDEKLLERFRRELVLARQVTHKNVVRIHDIGRDGDLVFLTMDLVKGRSLRQLLEERGALPVGEATEMVAQLAKALAAAHERDVIHRDLKPSNVMVDASGVAYITDFGIARSVASEGLTRTGFIIGTPEFLSPEQVRGDELDGRADIYALGVLLYELLSGKLPTSGATVDEILAQQLRGVPSKLSDLPKDVPANLRAILKRCLEPDRRRRYGSAAEVAADLETLARPRRQLPSRRALTRIAAAVGVSALAVAGWLFWNRSRPPGEAAASAEPAAAIVILPFADETQRPEWAWLSTGVPELMFESLIRRTQVRVVNPQRVAQAVSDLRLEPGSFSEAALDLASDLFDSSRLMTGNVRTTSGGGLRIDARLVNPAAGLEAAVFLHAEAPPGPGTVPQVVRELEAALLESLEVKGAVAELELESPALPKYSQAVQRLWRGDAMGARVLLEEAVVEDENFGAAWLRLSQAYEAMGQYEMALEAADTAVVTLGRDEASADRLDYLARGQQARLGGDPGQAQEILSELVEAYPSDIESAVELADAYGSEGQFGRALDLLSTITESAPANAQAWFLRAKYSILSGQSRVAIDEYLVRAMVLQNKLRNRQGQADVMNAFGVAYRELGEIAQAEQSYGRAAELRKEIGDERGYAASLHNLAQIAIYRGDFDAAESKLLEAKQTYEKLGDEAGIADFFNELGLMEEGRSDYRAALEHYRSGLQLRRELGDQRAIAESLNNIGFAHHQIGNYDDASVYWQQALDLYDQTENTEGQTTVRISLGQLHTTRGDWSAAQETLLEALNGARDLGWEPAIAATEGSLGRVVQEQGRYAAALAYYAAALERFIALEDQRGTLEFSLAKAQALVELGAGQRALDLLASLQESLDSVANADQQAEALALEGQARLLVGDTDGGTASLSKAVEAISDSANQALSLRVRLAHLGPSGSVSEVETLAREAGDLGDRRIELRTELALARALARADRATEARAALTRLDRLIRRSGEWSQAHQALALRANLAELEGDDVGEWYALREGELERIAKGLPAELAEAMKSRYSKEVVADAA